MFGNEILSEPVKQSGEITVSCVISSPHPDIVKKMYMNC